MKTVYCDVLVAGSGIAGFTAALKARSQGLKVIIAEKAPIFGGTSATSAGMPWVPANPAAAEHSDTAAKAMTYIENEIGIRLDHAKAEAYLSNCNAAVAFLENTAAVHFSAQSLWSDYHPHVPGAAAELRGLLPAPFDGRRLGTHFADLRPPLRSMMIFGRMMVGREDLPHLFNMRRSLRSALYCAGIFGRYFVDRLRYPRGTRLTNGNGLVAAVAAAAIAKGIPLWLASPVTQLLREENTVIGAVVERSGEEIAVRTDRGVILACGGFPWDEARKRQHYAHVANGKQHVSAAPRTNTGDGIGLGCEAGGWFDDTAANAAAWAPVSLVPQLEGPPVPFPHFIDRAKPGMIVVDRRGMRFTNEAVSYHDFVPRMIEVCRDDRDVEAFVICDHTAFRKYGLGAAPPAPAPFRSFVRRGYLLRGGTLEELAGHAGIDAAGLAATVARYNGFAVEGRDLDFGRGSDSYQRFNGDRRHGPNPCVGPIRDAPFYAVRIVPGDLGTFMGLKTDDVGRVLGESVPVCGLYAVGNDAASVFCGHYPGPGSTIGPAITFAYLAASDLGLQYGRRADSTSQSDFHHHDANPAKAHWARSTFARVCGTALALRRRPRTLPDEGVAE